LRESPITSGAKRQQSKVKWKNSNSHSMRFLEDRGRSFLLIIIIIIIKSLPAKEDEPRCVRFLPLKKRAKKVMVFVCVVFIIYPHNVPLFPSYAPIARKTSPRRGAHQTGKASYRSTLHRPIMPKAATRSMDAIIICIARRSGWRLHKHCTA